MGSQGGLGPPGKDGPGEGDSAEARKLQEGRVARGRQNDGQVEESSWAVLRGCYWKLRSRKQKEALILVPDIRRRVGKSKFKE